MRKKLSKYLIFFIILSFMVISQTALVQAEEIWPEVPELSGEAIVLMEATNSALLYTKNSDERMYPASTTKILTAIVVLENCSMDEIVTFTEECCYLEDGAVTIDSIPGEQMTVKDALFGLLLPSGNDCAMALAIHTAGSIEAFAEMMNAKAKEIGATESNFKNPSGLFHRDHYVTAMDLALIAQYAFQNSTFVDIISHPTYTIGPTNMTPENRYLTNSHEMIIPGSSDYNSNVIGGKTGYLYEAGRCLVTYAKKDGITLLSVILDGSYYGIFGETQELLDYGFSNFNIKNVSESETRFSYADSTSLVQLDPQSQIITLNNVDFTDLTSRITFAYDMDQTEYAQAKLDAGIVAGDSRRLYATIDYSYAGHYLGSCNVFINSALLPPSVSFINIYYINIWIVLVIIILIWLAVLFFSHMAEKSGYKKRHRRSPRGNRVYQDRPQRPITRQPQRVRPSARRDQEVYAKITYGKNRRRR